MSRPSLPIVGLLFLGSCASYSNLRFAPTIQDTDLCGEPNDIQAHVAVAWRGIEEREDIPEFRFRVRVDNPGPTPFTLVPADFELSDAALNSLGKAATDHIPVVVEAGQSAMFDVAFPVTEPFEELDMTALTLRAHFQGNRWSWSMTFHREEPAPPQTSFSFGVGTVIGF